MDHRQVQDALRRLGVRVGPEVAAYVHRRLGGGSGAVSSAAMPATIPVIGADARTGVPLRKEIAVAQLQQLADDADGYLPFARGNR